MGFVPCLGPSRRVALRRPDCADGLSTASQLTLLRRRLRVEILQGLVGPLLELVLELLLLALIDLRVERRTIIGLAEAAQADGEHDAPRLDVQGLEIERRAL